MTNLNTTPNPFGKHSFRDNAVDSAANQTYEFDIDGSVASSVENTATAKPKFGRRSFLTGFAGAALACMLAFGVQGAIIDPATAEATGTPSATQTVINTNDDATLAEAVAAKCLPSVVYVETYADAGGQLQGLGTGSGVVMTEDGYLITNNHVVDGGSAYKVTIAGNTYDAELVGTDPSSDVAVLKAKDASGLTPMEIGDSDNLTVGEWVMTLGAPFGLEQSVATGIVSATSRSQIMDASESMQSGGSSETTIYPNMIQTDAAINPGNSGGALVDDEGKLIGINTLITSYSGNYSGVGFAIPVKYAVNLAQQIIAGETPTHAQPVHGERPGGCQLRPRGRVRRLRGRRLPGLRRRGGRPPGGRHHHGPERRAGGRRFRPHAGRARQEPRRHREAGGEPQRPGAGDFRHPGRRRRQPEGRRGAEGPAGAADARAGSGL